MARGRHARRTGLLVWLFATHVQPVPRDTSWRAVHAQSLVLLDDEVRTLQTELAGLRAVQESSAAAAGLAEQRTGRLQEQLVAAESDLAELADRRIAALEQELVTARSDIAGLREELAALREELVWVFAERRPVLGADRQGAGAPASVRAVAG